MNNSDLNFISLTATLILFILCKIIFKSNTRNRLFICLIPVTYTARIPPNFPFCLVFKGVPGEAGAAGTTGPRVS